MFSKRFTRIYVGEVNLYKRDLRCQQRVTERDAGMGKGGWVDDDKINAVTVGLVDKPDEFMFGVALVKRQAMAKPVGLLC